MCQMYLFVENEVMQRLDLQHPPGGLLAMVGNTLLSLLNIPYYVGAEEGTTYIVDTASDSIISSGEKTKTSKKKTKKLESKKKI